MRYRAIFVLTLMLAGNAWPQSVITTFAGGSFIFTGNGQPAVNAPLGFVYGVAFDPAGNLVIADNGNCLVERINPDGTLAVIAGSGFCFGIHTGDGGSALNAALNSIRGVTYDSRGNLYIGEADRISQVSPQGIINTVAGGGSDAITNGIPALQAAISPEFGLVVDAAGAVYYSDYATNRVRRFTPGGTIATVAGTGIAGSSGEGGLATAAELNSPTGLALDDAGNLYIADLGNASVHEVTAAGVISTVIANTIATGLAFDGKGDLYISGAGEVQKLTPGSASPALIAGIPGSEGYSGDGGQAVGAQFGFIMTAAADSLGNLFVGDGANDRVRRISANGIVTTVAGNGQYYYTGEGVPAAITPVPGGGNLAIDSAGNIYYSDPTGERVRKVSAGIINTVAGTGVEGFSGDGGPALQATLNEPRNLALDSPGNLYIADYLNQRVRRVTKGGTISTYATLPGYVRGLVFDAAGNLYVAVETNSTVYRIDTSGKQTVFAGTGTAGYSGDGGPAIHAMLSGPSGLAMDALGNLYIADSQNGRVRMVNPQGVISSFVSGASNVRELAFDPAGNLYGSDETTDLVYKATPAAVVSVFAGGGSIYPGDGMAATQVSLGTPYGIVTDASGNVYIDDTFGIEVVLATPPTISLQSNNLSFSAASGGAPATQNVVVTGSVPALNLNIDAATSNGANWLSAGAASASTPELLSITADPANLAPGAYKGTIFIFPALATPAVLTVAVTFTVGAALPPQLSVDQPSLSFTYPNGAPAHSSTLKISNAGGGALGFTASAMTNAGGSWLAIAPAGGSVSPGTPVTLAVTADPSKLGPGNYTGSVSIESNGGGNITIPVNMGISSLSQALLLTQTGVSFTAVAQGGVVPPQSFGVVNLGTGSLGWSASASTLSGGSWLDVTPVGGSSDASLAAPQVTVAVNPNGLAAGDYYGLVQITAPGAANTPQVVSVFLTVLPAGSDPGASVQPSELFFPVTPGADLPGSQEVLVYNIGAAPETFFTGLPQLQFAITYIPRTATLNPSQPVRVLMQPYGTFAAGSFTDLVSFQFANGRVQTVKVHAIAAAVSSGAAGNARSAAAAASCVPTKLIPALTTLSQSFAIFAGYPNALSVQVLDDCGNPHLSGSVTVSFTNGDPELALSSLNSGIWQATWSAGAGSSGQSVSLNIAAVNPKLGIDGALEVDGAIGTAKSPPAVTLGGVVSAASPVSYTAVAPGSIIAIYGSLLADSANAASSVPLPATLGNATVRIGGMIAPLFYASNGQINAVVPFGLTTNTTQQMYIQRDGTVSNPVSINVADAQPGAFLYNGSAIVQDFRGAAAPFLVAPSAPAQAGDVLVFYCGGLGLVNRTVADGAGSPSAPTLASVSATIGGQSANVIYAGLVEGLVGLYQVNTVMPAGVTPGSSVPVTLAVAGQTSPMADIATQ